MHNNFLPKWIIASMSGIFAAMFGQYRLVFQLVAIAVILDVITGFLKSQATGEGLSSKKAFRGLWRKASLFAALLFGMFLDYASANVLAHAGVSFGQDTAFAMIICAYIIINEAISIAENLYLSNPDSFPKWIAERLKVAKDQENKKL